MAGIKPHELGSMAPGVNNRRRDTDMATVIGDAPATFLRGAVNVDLNSVGKISRRLGQTVLVGNPSVHSLWSDDKGALVAIDDQLQVLTIDGDGAAHTSAIAALAVKTPISYSRGSDGDVYWTNGAQIRRVVQGVDRPIATAAPQAPVITVGSGALPAGAYLVAATSYGVDGESAATPVQRIEVPADSSLTVTSSQTVSVYMSAPDGDVLTAQAVGQSVQIVTFSQSGPTCKTLNLAPLPPGQIVRHHIGRMLVARDNLLLIGEPFNFGLYRPSRGFIPFPAAITMVESVEGGLYVAADKTYFLADLFGGAPVRDVLPYGAIPGTSGHSPSDAGQVFWQSERGLVIADAQGNAKAVQEANLRLTGGASGATLYRERDGDTHVVASRAPAGLPVAAASSYFEARIIQRGTDL